VFIFELKLVNSKGMTMCNGEDIDEIVLKCSHCGLKAKPEYGLTVIHLSEFHLATLLRILKSRNKELYDKLNRYYENVTSNIDIM